jgi:hypothetical protein
VPTFWGDMLPPTSNMKNSIKLKYNLEYKFKNVNHIKWFRTGPDIMFYDLSI